MSIAYAFQSCHPTFPRFPPHVYNPLCVSGSPSPPLPPPPSPAPSLASRSWALVLRMMRRSRWGVESGGCGCWLPVGVDPSPAYSAFMSVPCSRHRFLLPVPGTRFFPRYIVGPKLLATCKRHLLSAETVSLAGCQGLILYYASFMILWRVPELSLPPHCRSCPPFPSLCRFLCVCVSFCSHWSLVDVPLIFFCPADHVPDWQPRILLGMVEARSVNVKKTNKQTKTPRPRSHFRCCSHFHSRSRLRPPVHVCSLSRSRPVPVPVPAPSRFRLRPRHGSHPRDYSHVGILCMFSRLGNLVWLPILLVVS